MVLANDHPSATKIFAGPGEPRYSDSGLLEVVVYDQSHQPNPRDLFPQLQPGSWVPGSEFFSLRALDFYDRVGIADGVRPDVNSSFGIPGAVVRGWVREAMACGDASKEWNDWLWLYFSENIQIPANVATVTTIQEGDKKRGSFERNIWEFVCGDLKLRFRRRDLGLDVEVNPTSSSLLSSLDIRIEEAIWFSLGHSLAASCVQRRNGSTIQTILRSRLKGGKVTRPNTPCALFQPNAPEIISSLFWAFLNHVLPYDDERFHPLSVSVKRVIRGASGTLEEEALAHCVAAEGLVETYFKEHGKPEPEVLDAAAELETLLDRWPGNEVIQRRTAGFLGALSGVKSRTALLGLGRQGMVAQSQVDAWEELRHPSTHGAELQLAPRDLLEKTASVRPLFFDLALRAVGYSGPATDCTEVGWPTRTIE